MPGKKARQREKAFRMRVDRKTFAEIGKSLSVSPKTVSRWENGWTDGRGRKHAGWLSRLERAWREIAEMELEHELIEREESLKAIDELARMNFNRLKEFLPTIKIRNAADAKALLSEFRELIRLAAQKRGESLKPPNTIVAIKADITLDELQKRHAAAKARRARHEKFLEGEVDDGSDIEEAGGAEGDPGLAEDG